MSQKDFDQYLEYYKRTFKHHQEERMRNLWNLKNLCLNI
jgi:hypothetical protein